MTSKVTASLFDNIKYCDDCHRVLHMEYKGNLCPGCIDRQLFSKVKEFIRANDVNEHDVATHFSIPLSRVKGWIREGRIEYKDLSLKSLPNMHCQKCGDPITFGALCSKCLRQAGTKGASTSIPLGDKGQVRHRIK